VHWDKSLDTTVGQCLNFSSHMEVSCVPSAAHMSFVHRGQNKVIGIIVFATLILEMSLCTTIKYEVCG